MSNANDKALQRLEVQSERTWELLNRLVERVATIFVPMGTALDQARVHAAVQLLLHEGDPDDTVGAISQTVPVSRSFDELMHAVGEEVGRRHGEAVARAEHGAVDAWQVALGALAHLRVCIGSALQATPRKASP